MQQGSELNMEPGPGPVRKKRRRVALSPRKGEISGWVAQGRSDAWIASALGTTPSSVQSFRSRHNIYRRTENTAEGTAGAAAEAGARRAPARGEPKVYEGVLEHGEEVGYGLWLDPAVTDDPAFERSFAGVSDIRVTVEEGRMVLEPVAPASASGSASAAPLERPSGGALPAEASLPSPASDREHGTVKWYDEEKGYGFIYRPDGGDIFVHRSQIDGGDTLEATQEVSYEVGSNQRGLIAECVRAAG